MKKTIITLLILAAITGCSKTSQDSPSSSATSSGNSTWTLGNNSYSGNSELDKSILSAADSKGISTIVLGTTKFPTSSDSFKIVNEVQLGPKTLYILVTTPKGAAYASYDIDNKYANINVTNGKLSVAISKLMVYGLTTGDSLQLTATINQ